MTKTIAIQPDRYDDGHGPVSFSDRWLDIIGQRTGMEAKLVDVRSPEWPKQIAGCCAFLWRGTGVAFGNEARKVIPAINQGLGIPTLPGTTMAASYRDKVAQQYLLEAAGIPTPQTWVFHDADSAREFIAAAPFPLVVKLPSGRGSKNVALLKSRSEAERCISVLFHNGVRHLWQALGSRRRFFLRQSREAVAMLRGAGICRDRQGWVAFFQEFLPGNQFDTRVIVIGRYACALRRHNRPNDFRASGGGGLDWDQAEIDPAAVSLGYRVSRALDMPFVAIDVIYRDKEPVVCEINFSYVAWGAHYCPGYWFLEDDAAPETAAWKQGYPDPEGWTLDEFLHLSGLAQTS